MTDRYCPSWEACEALKRENAALREALAEERDWLAERSAEAEAMDARPLALAFEERAVRINAALDGHPCISDGACPKCGLSLASPNCCVVPARLHGRLADPNFCGHMEGDGEREGREPQPGYSSEGKS